MRISGTACTALLVRILIALCTRTFFQPDEYFQSIEPAHHIVYGYGHLTWEWRIAKPIRSIIYPALNIPVLLALKVCGLSETSIFGGGLLIYAVKFLHGVLAAATDIWVCEIARRCLGRQYMSTTLFLSLTSFFHALSLSRSLSNSLETSLTTVALAYYPWEADPGSISYFTSPRSDLTKLLTFAALACMIRPTNAILWVYLIGNLLWTMRSRRGLASAVLFQTFIIGIMSCLILFWSDSMYYGKLTFTPWNFLSTNLSSVSLFYGSSPWHFYFTQALPILCTTSLPFVFHGIWLVVHDHQVTALRTMLAALFWYIGIYSLAGHKEWRFIHPILPLLHIIAARSLVEIFDIQTQKSSKKMEAKKLHASSLFGKIRGNIPPIRIQFLSLIALNIPASLFVIFIYRRAPISVLSYIRSLPDEEFLKGVGFLMPCHSTPGYAYIHRPELARGILWALGCEPPLDESDSSTYQDQADVFFQSPKHYLETYFPSQLNTSFPLSSFPTTAPGETVRGVPAILGKESVKYPWRHEWPCRLVFFGNLLLYGGVRELLRIKGYKEIWRKGWNWEGEGHERGGVRVWQWQSV